MFRLFFLLGSLVEGGGERNRIYRRMDRSVTSDIVDLLLQFFYLILVLKKFFKEIPEKFLGVSSLLIIIEENGNGLESSEIKLKF